MKKYEEIFLNQEIKTGAPQKLTTFTGKSNKEQFIHDQEQYQTLKYQQPIVHFNISEKKVGDMRANAKSYNYLERPLIRNLNEENIAFQQSVFPKTFLENYLTTSKGLLQRAPIDYKGVLTKNIQNLGGVEDTIAKMEESLRENELRNVYSYCELDDPKFLKYNTNTYPTDITNPFQRAPYEELDKNLNYTQDRNKYLGQYLPKPKYNF